MFFFSLRCSVSLFYFIRPVLAIRDNSRLVLHSAGCTRAKAPVFRVPGGKAQEGSPGCFWWGLAALPGMFFNSLPRRLRRLYTGLDPAANRLLHL
jgi:hypothetical protein